MRWGKRTGRVLMLMATSQSHELYSNPYWDKGKTRLIIWKNGGPGWGYNAYTVRPVDLVRLLERELITVKHEYHEDWFVYVITDKGMELAKVGQDDAA